MADFATVAELEAFMGTSGLGTRGTALLGYASAEIRGYTGQDLEETAGRQEEFAADYREYLWLSQKPVTAVSAVTIDAVAFADFGWTRWGKVYLLNTSSLVYWSTGATVVTYDSGYSASSDEMQQVKEITLEVAARAIGGPQGENLGTFGAEIPELRGAPLSVFLTEQEQQRLDRLSGVPVG